MIIIIIIIIIRAKTSINNNNNNNNNNNDNNNNNNNKASFFVITCICACKLLYETVFHMYQFVCKISKDRGKKEVSKSVQIKIIMNEFEF